MSCGIGVAILHVTLVPGRDVDPLLGGSRSFALGGHCRFGLSELPLGTGDRRVRSGGVMLMADRAWQ
eukprot:4895674-Amphidinium_carterae.1